MAIHDNWKAALSQMETAHKKLCDRFALAGEGTKGDIQIKMDMLEDSVTELTTKITKHEADNGVVPQNTHFPLQVSTQTQKCIASLSQSIETFLELETLIARDPSVSRTSLRDFNKYSNELAAFFVVPFGKKIMDSDELKKAYFNDTLFNKIASGTTLGVADNAHLDTLFNDADTAPAYHRSVITSALTLGLMHSYDAQKAIRLINIINDGERFVWKRALVGLTVALMDKQDQLNDGVVRRLEGLKEKPSVQKEFIALSSAFEELEDKMAFIQYFSGLI